MKKIIISMATTLIASAALVACNSGSTNASDVNSPGSNTPLAKAVCTSSNNWQSVGIGMSAGQVQARLGQPAQIISKAENTEYHYEGCRGFYIIPDGEPPYTIVVGGVVVISGMRGVISSSSPERPEEKISCEWNFYDYPFAAGQTDRVCRTASNPF